MTEPFLDPKVPESMKKQWESQVQLLPETLRPLVTGYLWSSYIWGLQHGYERKRDG